MRTTSSSGPRWKVYCPYCKQGFMAPLSLSLACPSCAGRVEIRRRGIRTRAVALGPPNPLVRDSRGRTIAPPVGLDSPGRLARAARREAREHTEPTFQIVLTAIDPSQRAATVQVVRDITDFPQEACERLIDQLPSVIETGMDRAEAEALKARFGDFRATAELKPQSAPAAAPEPVVEPVSTGEPNGLAGELDRIGALHRDGTLTDDEFAAAKAKILGS
jgi:ribosomal protein L7/L12